MDEELLYEMSIGTLEDLQSIEAMYDLTGKVAVVSGSIGLALNVIYRLVSCGARIVFGARRESIGQQVEEHLKGLGFGVRFFKFDTRDVEECRNLVAFAEEVYGTVDIWSFAHIEDLEEDVFKNTLDVNLLGAYRCAKHVSRYMIEHQIKGKLLLVSSNSAYLPQPVFGGYAHYTASKGGVWSR